jgi:hypothetical protein
MATPDATSLEQFQILTERAGLNLTPDEVAALKPMYDFYAAQIRSLHEIPLDAEDLAVSFSPTWDPQV